MKLILDNQCTLSGISPQIKQQLKDKLSFKNPKYLEAKMRGRWTGNLKKVLSFYTEKGDIFSFPRGFLREALNITGRNLAFEDRRRILPPIDLNFTGTLRPCQDEAVKKILKKDFGVLQAPCGAGKTVIALKIIAKRQQPTLIIVHSVELLEQWRSRIKTFLGVDAGLIGNGKYEIQPVTVGIVNTVRKHLNKLPQYFGQVINDECHRCCSATFSEVVRAFDSKYALGCSATPYRRDKLTRLIYWFVGPLVHKIDLSELQGAGVVLVPEVIFKQTDFYYSFHDDYSKMISVLTKDSQRNGQIAQDVLREAREVSGVSLVVSDRIEHCKAISELITRVSAFSVRILTSQLKRKERMSLIKDIREGKIDILISTLQLIGEGFDFAEFSSLFLATPIKFSGRLIQVVGRILRPQNQPARKPRVFDYCDPAGPLFASAKSRKKTYSEMGWL